MATTVHLRLTGQAEEFLNLMRNNGFSERDVIAKALGVLHEVWASGRVARLKRGYEQSDAVEFVYSMSIKFNASRGDTPASSQMAGS